MAFYATSNRSSGFINRTRENTCPVVSGTKIDPEHQVATNHFTDQLQLYECTPFLGGA